MIVVIALSYSRNSGQISDDSEMWAPGSARRSAAPSRCSWTGIRVRVQQTDGH